MFCSLSFLLAACKGSSREGVTIALIDTGVCEAVLPAGSILPGQNYIFPESGTDDLIGHGTSVAGFILGSGNKLVEGNCPEAKIVPLVYASKDENGEQVIGAPGLVADAIFDAVDKFKCDIILIPSGTKKEDMQLKEAVLYAAKNGATIISCAGNDGTKDIFYPGGYDEVICVGSSDEDGNRASFSQDNDTVDILERGCDLRLLTLNGKRIRGEGTSYSAAIAAGRAAKLLLENPKLTASEIKERLKDK